MTKESWFWIQVGFVGQAIFTARFIVQWLASEKNKQVTVPVAFWWFSLAGGLVLFSYAAHREDPVFMVGQSLGLFVYIRNLMLLQKRDDKPKRKKRRAKTGVHAAHVDSTPKPHMMQTIEGVAEGSSVVSK